MIKEGESGSNTKSIEEYNEIFLLIDSGLLGLILSLISGMVIGELNIELILKLSLLHLH